jgi:hypothetical protein
MNTSALVWFALCCCSSLAVPLPDRRLRQTDRNATDAAASVAETDQPFDPSLDALADAKYDDDNDGSDAATDDRAKRQLSFVQGKLLNFLKVRASHHSIIIIIIVIIIIIIIVIARNRRWVPSHICDSISFDQTRVIYPIPRPCTDISIIYVYIYTVISTRHNNIMWLWQLNNYAAWPTVRTTFLSMISYAILFYPSNPLEAVDFGLAGDGGENGRIYSIHH